MINESFEEFNSRIEKKHDEYEKEMDSNILKANVEIFDALKEAGVDYLSNEDSICLAYKTFIYFILNEDYERCSIISKILEEFDVIRFKKMANRHKQMLLKSRDLRNG